MRPYIICHMLSSVDGKFDGSALNGLSENGEYEIIPEAAEQGGKKLNCGLFNSIRN